MVLKAVFHKFYLVHSWIFCRIWSYNHYHIRRSSNVNEVIRPVLNSLFFSRKDFAGSKSTKSIKSTKSTKTQPSKSPKRHKRTKTKNALKKHLRGEKLLLCLFVFLSFLCTRRKENSKKKIEKREKSPQGRRTKYWCPQN